VWCISRYPVRIGPLMFNPIFCANIKQSYISYLISIRTMRFLFSFILGLFLLTFSLFTSQPLITSPNKQDSSPILAATVTPSAVNPIIKLRVFLTRDSLTLYVPQSVSLNGFQWEYEYEGEAKLSSLSENFDMSLVNMATDRSCFVYKLEGTNPVLAQSCDRDRSHIKPIAPSDVFWYDAIKNQGNDLLIFRDDINTEQSCPFGNPNCPINWEVRAIKSNDNDPSLTPPRIGIAPFVNCSQSSERIWDKINPNIENLSSEATINDIVDQTVARVVAEQKHYDILIWWHPDDIDEEVMRIEILRPPVSKDIQELKSVQIPIEGCDLRHAEDFAQVIIKYLYANVDNYDEIDHALVELAASNPNLLPPTYKDQTLPSESALIAFFRANLKLYATHYSEAINYYDAAIQAAPTWAEAYFNQGIAYFNNGYAFLYKAYASRDRQRDDIQQAKQLAVNAFENAIQYAKEDEIKAQASLNSAQTFYLLGYLNFNAASVSYDYVYGLHACNKLNDMTGLSAKTQAQEDVCHAALEIQRCGQLFSHIHRNCGSKDDLQNAMKYLDQATEKAPELIDIYLWRGVALSLRYEYGCRLKPPIFGSELKPIIEENLKKYWQVVQTQHIKLRIDNTTLAYAYKGFGVVECTV